MARGRSGTSLTGDKELDRKFKRLERPPRLTLVTHALSPEVPTRSTGAEMP